MPSFEEITRLACHVNGDEDLVYYRIDLLSEFGEAITTLEYADITDDFNDLLSANKEMNIYSDIEDLKKDLAQAKLNRYVGKGQGNQRIELMVGLVAKLKHQTGICKDTCIYCNPDLGSDPFPDFTFDIKNLPTEGTS